RGKGKQPTDLPNTGANVDPRSRRKPATWEASLAESASTRDTREHTACCGLDGFLRRAVGMDKRRLTPVAQLIVASSLVLIGLASLRASADAALPVAGSVHVIRVAPSVRSMERSRSPASSVIQHVV